METPLVRHGQDVQLAYGGHTLPAVYSEMLLQICHDFPSLPDPRTLRLHEIRFYYDGIRADLKHYTKVG